MANALGGLARIGALRMDFSARECINGEYTTRAAGRSDRRAVPGSIQWI